MKYLPMILLALQAACLTDAEVTDAERYCDKDVPCSSASPDDETYASCLEYYDDLITFFEASPEECAAQRALLDCIVLEGQCEDRRLVSEECDDEEAAATEQQECSLITTTG